jgi:hypothetical protein
MGLDMYLQKAKRVKDVSVEQLVHLNNYFDYLERPEDCQKFSMEEWCGDELGNVNVDLIEDYIAEYIQRYSSWDEEKRYGYKTIFQQIAVWRKANHIHKWFVDNVQDGIDNCESYEVTEKHLQELLNICVRVKKASKLVKGKIQNGYTYANGKMITNFTYGEYIDDPSVAKELLPTDEGFFFGSTNYDQWYMEDVDYTINILNKILKETDFQKEIVIYSSSW